MLKNKILAILRFTKIKVSKTAEQTKMFDRFNKIAERLCYCQKNDWELYLEEKT